MTRLPKKHKQIKDFLCKFFKMTHREMKEAGMPEEEKKQREVESKIFHKRKD